MAMPSPASESMEMDCATMAGISTCHLRKQFKKTFSTVKKRKFWLFFLFFEVPEWNKRPSKAKQAGISIGVSDKFSPHHYQNQPCHYTCWWHCLWHSIITPSFLSSHFMPVVAAVHPSVSKAELFSLHIFSSVPSRSTLRCKIQPVKSSLDPEV